MDTITKSTKTKQDFLPLLGTDYIEFYVGNAKQAAHYYRSVFGFQPVAYAGPETGVRGKASYVIRQNKITLMLTSSLLKDDEIAAHVNKHGDGVKVLALGVNDAFDAHEQTTKRGGKSYLKPTTLNDEHGEIRLSGIHTYGDVVHLFVERKSYRGTFMPGFIPWKPEGSFKEVGLLYVDHCVGNVGWNEMNPWVKFYEDVMGFSNILSFDDNDISTEYSALMSKVMSNGNGYVKFPINEPAEGKKKSQVEEYLEFYNGQGVQHIAVATHNIIETVTQLKNNGLAFLMVPHTYYDELEARVGKIDEDIKALGKLGILVDRDDQGYLLQLFSKPVQDRPTLFFEIIQRKGALSFGKGNFKALFESLEREQALRGNL